MPLPAPALSQPFRIAVYPPRVVQRGNPYFTLCHAALEKHGIAAVDDLAIDLGHLRGRAGTLDAVHLHWPEDIWRKDFSRAAGRLGRALRAGQGLLYLRRFLRAARALGIERVWTVHNMEPHEGAYRWDHYGYRLLARETDVVICHSRSTMEAVQREYRPRGRVILMPIGELGSAYPAPRPRAQVLSQLGLNPERPTVSCLGRLRDYKGLDLACEAVARLKGRVQLVLGGPRHAGFDTGPIRAAVARTPGLVLIERVVTDQEFADIMGASDAALLSYRKITGSAALLSALGFGRGSSRPISRTSGRSSRTNRTRGSWSRRAILTTGRTRSKRTCRAPPTRATARRTGWRIGTRGIARWNRWWPRSGRPSGRSAPMPASPPRLPHAPHAEGGQAK